MRTVMLRCLSLLTPPGVRDPWLRRWQARLDAIEVMADRGELPRGRAAASYRTWPAAAGEAFWLRFDRRSLERGLRGPYFALGVAAMAICAAAVLTRGFLFSRKLFHLALEAGAWEAGDLLVAHALPIATGLAVGACLLSRRLDLIIRAGWRYWLFLLVKTAAVAVAVPVFWIEFGAAVSPVARSITGRAAGLLGVFSAAAFIVVFAGALAWSFADQRRRCPVCLERLAMPVPLGSWASVFEPPRTELLCGRGHGALCVSEAGLNAGAKWVRLDESWRGLFA